MVSFADVRKFEEDGYLVVRGLLDQEELNRLHGILYRNAGDDWRRPQSICYGLPTSNRDIRLTEKLDKDLELLGFGCRGTLAHVVRTMTRNALMRLWQVRCLIKDPWCCGTSLHSDFPYLGMQCRHALTCWIPLQEVDAHNGALIYLRGSHRLDLSGLLTDTGPVELRYTNEIYRIVPNLAEMDVVTVSAQPGDCLVHNIHIVHAAHPNMTNGVRAALTLAYVDQAATFTGTGRADFHCAPSLPGECPPDDIYPPLEGKNAAVSQSWQRSSY